MVSLRALPGRISAVGGILRDRIPTPTELSRVHIIGPNNARRQVQALVVADGGPDDHQVADDGRRRSLLDLRSQAGPQIDAAGIAKSNHRRAGMRVDRDQPPIDRANEYAE